MLERTPTDINRAEQVIAPLGRSCGACSMCCYVLDIDDPDFQKPANEWCKHCKPGNGGCSIYKDRPPACRGFACQWLVQPALGDEWYPPRSKMVLHFNRAGSPSEIGLRLHINVDRRFPNRWREEPYFSQIKQFSIDGLERHAPPLNYRTYVVVGERSWLIAGDLIVEDAEFGITLPLGEHKFKFIQLQNEAEVERLDRALTQMRNALVSKTRHLAPAQRHARLIEMYKSIEIIRGGDHAAQ